jgi:hypothetical protein
MHDRDDFEMLRFAQDDRRELSARDERRGFSGDWNP